MGGSLWPVGSHCSRTVMVAMEVMNMYLIGIRLKEVVGCRVSGKY